jgi:signal recognition particle receptor subunit beta
MQRLSAIECQPMESLSSQQQQKHQKMRLPMTTAQEFEQISIDWDVPLH